MGENQVDAEVMMESVDEQTLSAVYRVLSHTDRSALIAALDQRNEPLPLSDAAEEVAQRNGVTDSEEATQAQIKRKYLLLHHKHVPTLTDAGIVYRNDEDKTIRLTDWGDEIATVQQIIADQYSGDE